MVPIADLCVGHQGDESALECAETAFDFSLGLRGWSDMMRHPQSAEGTLKLAPWIGAVASGTWSEKT